VPIDKTIAKALASDDPDDLAQVIGALEMLAERLAPRILKLSHEDSVS
jgi:hypothetical protein